MDAMLSQAEQDKALREDLRTSMHALASASDRKHASSLASWYGEFTSKQRGFARVLLQRAQEASRSGKAPASVGDIWDSPAGQAAKQELVAAAPPQHATVSGSDLESAVAKAIEPAIAGATAQLKAQFANQQRDFESGAVKVIAQSVLAAALRELEARKPREVRIEVTREGTTRRVEGLKHFQLEHALAATSANVPLMLVGPAGSGKTQAGEQIANALGLKFYVQGAASGTHEYLGYKDGAGVYHTTPYRAAFEHGGLFMAEELDSGSADVPLILNAGLANGYQAFPDRTEPVRRHADFRIIANANTYGNGADRVYVGRTQLDGATIDRFAFIDWRYDEKLELQIASNADWTRRVQQIRAAVNAEKARMIVSPRASILGGKLLAAGLERSMVENMVIWKGVSDEQRKRIEARLGGVK